MDSFGQEMYLSGDGTDYSYLVHQAYCRTHTWSSVCSSRDVDTIYFVINMVLGFKALMYFTYVLSVYTLGLGFGFVVGGLCSQYISGHYSNKDKFIYVPETREMHMMRYPLNMRLREEQLSKPKEERYVPSLTSYVMDSTPNGLVSMRYDGDSETFEYYCDDRTIPFDMLETVARKYVHFMGVPHLYRCADNVINNNTDSDNSDTDADTDTEYESGESDCDVTDTSEYVDVNTEYIECHSETEEPSRISGAASDDGGDDGNDTPGLLGDDSVFAQLKSRETLRTNNEDVNNDDNDVDVNPNPNENTENERVLREDEVNRYRYLGKIVDMDMQRKDQRVQSVAKDKKMTFSMFKNMFGFGGSEHIPENIVSAERED